MASILGGTLTLIGSAPNIIVSSHLLSASGSSFGMFDFAPHGLAMLAVALLVLYLYRPTEKGLDGEAAPGLVETEVFRFAPFSSRSKQLTLLIITLAVLSASTGLLHTALGFGGAALGLILAGVIKLPAAYQSIDFRIVVFLGSMLGIGQVLEYTGSLGLLSDVLAPLTEGLSPLALIFSLVFLSSALSNAINNAAAAVFMAPLAATIAQGSGLQVAAALMAVAAGTNMTLLLPTHQATQMVLSKAPFPTNAFVRTGFLLTLCCGVVASLMIAVVWQGF